MPSHFFRVCLVEGQLVLPEYNNPSFYPGYSLTSW
jgi:hypothetical protein